MCKQIFFKQYLIVSVDNSNIVDITDSFKIIDRTDHSYSADPPPTAP